MTFVALVPEEVPVGRASRSAPPAIVVVEVAVPILPAQYVVVPLPVQVIETSPPGLMVSPPVAGGLSVIPAVALLPMVILAVPPVVAPRVMALVRVSDFWISRMLEKADV